jgi:hypothetical protein
MIEGGDRRKEATGSVRSGRAGRGTGAAGPGTQATHREEAPGSRPAVFTAGWCLDKISKLGYIRCEVLHSLFARNLKEISSLRKRYNPPVPNESVF